MRNAIKSEQELQAYLETGNKKLAESERYRLEHRGNKKQGEYTIGKSYLPKLIFSQTLMYIFLIVFAIFILLPFLFMISTSFISQTTFEMNKSNNTITLLPIPFTFENYVSVFAPTYVDNLGIVQEKTSF